MEKLLQWSIAQQSGDKEALEKIGKPDFKQLEQLFGGPDEPTLMKHSIAVVVNPEATLESKEVAMDNFEMLIENLDNANNIENLKMWPILINQLKNDKPESIRVYAASIVGISVQNNLKAQEDFNKHDGLKVLLELAAESQASKELYLKVLLAISSFLRNYPDGYKRFDELDGWNVINLSTDVDHKIKLRNLSLISAIFSTGLDEKKKSRVKSMGLIQHLVSFFTKDGHLACTDSSLNIISQLVSSKYSFDESELRSIAQGLSNIHELRENLTVDSFDIVKNTVNKK